MGAMDAKFQKAAQDLGHVLPRIEDPFWNFYRNVAQDPKPAITIPVVFYKGGAVVAQANFICLGSPYQLNLLAIDQTIQNLKTHNPSLQWDSVNANGGEKLTAAQIAALQADPLLRASANRATSLFAAIEHLMEDLHRMKPGTTDPETLRKEYEQAKTAFVSSVTLQTAQIDWIGERKGLAHRLGRILGLS
jgi:hypothetical protein